jgi:hypothetical protein
VQQKVASSLLFFTDSSARYNVLNANVCTSIRASYGNTLMTSGLCDANNLGQFRIAVTSNGNFTIATAVNSTSQPVAPQWALTSATGTVTSATAAVDATQRWTIVKRADGKYRLLNEAYGTCASVSTTQSYTGSGFHVVGAVCNDTLAAQGFTFAQVSSPIPVTPYTMACSGSQWSLAYTWTIVEEYRQEVSFQAFVDGTFLKSIGPPGQGGNYNSTLQLLPAELPAATWGAGTHALTIKQSIAGSPWSTVATGTIRIVADTTVVGGIYCS